MPHPQSHTGFEQMMLDDYKEWERIHHRDVPMPEVILSLCPLCGEIVYKWQAAVMTDVFHWAHLDCATNLLDR